MAFDSDWFILAAMIDGGASPLHFRLAEALHAEATALAAQARDYFDGVGRADRDALRPIERVAFSCESLKITTRLMHVLAWLLNRRALDGGEIGREAPNSSPRLGPAPETDTAVLAAVPDAARALIAASADLHRRVTRLDAARQRDTPMPGPARALRDRLALVPKAG